MVVKKQKNLTGIAFPRHFYKKRFIFAYFIYRHSLNQSLDSSKLLQTSLRSFISDILYSYNFFLKKLYDSSVIENLNLYTNKLINNTRMLNIIYTNKKQ